MVEAWLFARLANTAALRLIVPDLNRICPVKLPQREKNDPFDPAVVYRKTSTNRTQHTRGSGGYAKARFEIRCWSTDYLQTKTMADAIRMTVDSQQANQVNVKVRRAEVTDEADDDEAPWLYDDVTTYATVLQLEIDYAELGPQIT